MSTPIGVWELQGTGLLNLLLFHFWSLGFILGLYWDNGKENGNYMFLASSKRPKHGIVTTYGGQRLLFQIVWLRERAAKVWPLQGCEGLGFVLGNPASRGDTLDSGSGVRGLQSGDQIGMP